MRLLRTKRRLFDRRRARIGGHVDITFVSNAPQHHRACWHVPPMRDTDRTTRPNHASRPAPPALLIIDSVSAVITASFFGGDMGAVSRVFVEVGWRRGLGAEKPRSGSGKAKQGPGGRRRRKRGAGGRARCMWWPRRALFGCAALKSAHPSSRQTVPRRALRKESRSDFFHVS